MFGLFKKRVNFDEAAKEAFLKSVVTVLSIPLEICGNRMEDESGRVNRKALGYIYGFLDAALRNRGVDMADAATSVPITFSVLNRMFGGHSARTYTEFLIKHIGKDPVLQLGVMSGGQQYVDWMNRKIDPMGFGTFLIEGDQE